ncbi:MAG: cell cycle transcriptional regulator TrcR [Hyphomonadaceae bacterium]|nr:cell cycle transcriptional regulator TrcR [Hyphomonadaceae bacterium]
MTQNVLMPKATAVWLIENTSLAFNQIAEFCGLHPLEVQGIANEDVAKGIRGVDPIAGGFLSREEIAKGEADPAYKLKPLEQKRIDIPQVKKRGARYTPIARRGDRPDAIYWFLKNHPEIADSKVVKLIGTTKATIDQVRNRTHWNASNIKPVDPVSLGLCTQIELDRVVSEAAAAKQRADARAAKVEAKTLKTAQETVPPETYERASEDATAED